jgi:predicted phosphoadenosine phosphosulfate sulfurtransferase
MLEEIMSMQEDKEKKLEEMIGKKYESAKRTTIILEKEEREFVDQLIREGKEPGIKPLISKMLDVYRSMMIYDWRFPGEYYCGISRIAFVNVELLNILIQHIPDEEYRIIGRNMGDALKISIETTLDIQTVNREKWPEVFKRLRVQGFGDIYLRDKYMLIKTPFINEAEIWAGFLEGLLNIKLDVKTASPPLVFEIKEETTVSKGE